MATSLTYNGVQLYNCVTLEFAQSPLRDASGTDLIGWEYLIRVRGIVAVHNTTRKTQNALIDGQPIKASAGVAIGTVATNTADANQTLRLRLGKDRCELTYAVDGHDVLHVAPSTAAVETSAPNIQARVDVNNGPKVESVNVSNIASQTCFVEFAVKVAIVECQNDLGTDRASWENTHKVLSNRWSCADDLDDLFRTTRRVQGILRLSTPVHSPHEFRGLVVPPLAKGFCRKRMAFTADPTGLQLAYEIVDQEMVGPAPLDPAMKMRITHTEGMGGDVNNCIGEVHVDLEGGRASDKGDMLIRAMQVVVNRLFLDEESQNVATIEFLAITDVQGQDVNTVSVACRVKHASFKFKTKDKKEVEADMGAIMLHRWGSPLDPDFFQRLPPRTDTPKNQQPQYPYYDPDSAPVWNPEGSAGIAGLFICYLQTPCGAQHGITDGKQAAETVSDNARDESVQPTQLTYRQGSIPAYFSSSNDSNLTAAAQEFAYTHYQIDDTVTVKSQRVFLPLASDDSGSSGSTTPQDSLAPVRLSPAVAFRVLAIHAERTGDWPQMIRPEDFKDHFGIQHWLRKHKLMKHAPIPKSNGVGKVFSMQGRYRYALARAPQADEPLNPPTLPWDAQASKEYDPKLYINADDHEYGLY
jgi:hypothetical protein